MIKHSTLFTVLIVSLLLIFTQLANGQGTPRGVAEQLLKDDSMVKELSQMNDWSINEVTRRLSSKKVDLNSDGSLEYIVSGIGCGAQNCPHWIYRKSGNKFIQIPVDGDFTAAVVKVRKTKAKGYLDLVAYYHSSAESGATTIYKFNGRSYIPK